ncbi:upstream stimulatory factor 2-like isoform X2 [Physella acuta]|uniref:upstream stimulatory factor 2-like isoform X2 n=1 Tax=Physella acuta TaxID=109671 RepID=UPI0027DDC6A0|nr:upstream stimulatory factor 2-like isoform X2 [Physella acuta]
MEMLEQALDSSQDKSNDSADPDDIRLSTNVDTDLVCKVKQELNQLESSSMELSGTVEADLDHADEQAAAIASVQQQQGTITLDSTLQYQIRADNSAGQVTYRVVQVAHDGTETASQLVGGAGGYAAQQAVIQSPFSNGGSPTGEGADARFAYFPAPAATDGTVVASQGQFYVMMSPQDVLQGQRQIAPRTSFSPKLEGGGIRTARDDRRRATHNEVERRRRDKINNWIVQLSKLVPDCAQEPIKQTQASKGGILSKACEYIQELRTTNNRLAETLKDTERYNVDNELLRQQCEELKQENALLRSHLQQHGIVLDLGSGPS